MSKIASKPAPGLGFEPFTAQEGHVGVLPAQTTKLIVPDTAYLIRPVLCRGSTPKPAKISESTLRGWKVCMKSIFG